MDKGKSRKEKKKERQIKKEKGQTKEVENEMLIACCWGRSGIRPEVRPRH